MIVLVWHVPAFAEMPMMKALRGAVPIGVSIAIIMCGTVVKCAPGIFGVIVNWHVFPVASAIENVNGSAGM